MIAIRRQLYLFEGYTNSNWIIHIISSPHSSHEQHAQHSRKNLSWLSIILNEPKGMKGGNGSNIPEKEECIPYVKNLISVVKENDNASAYCKFAELPFTLTSFQKQGKSNGQNKALPSCGFIVFLFPYLKVCIH